MLYYWLLRMMIFFLKHKSFYLFKKKKEKETVPFLLSTLLSGDTAEADRLRILDIFANLESLYK